MKILYITSTWFLDCDFPLLKRLITQGVEVYLCIKVYTRALTSTIIDIKEAYDRSGIFDSGIYGNAIDKFKDYLGIDKIRIINITSKDSSLKTFSLYPAELKMINDINPDIINFVSEPSLYEMPLVRKFGHKIVLTIHDPLPHVDDIKSKFYNIVHKPFWKSINRFILLNKRQIDGFSKYHNVPERKIEVASLGNYDIINQFGDIAEWNNQSILYFGRISPYKGIEYLLEAFERIKKDYPSLKLVVAGGGKYYFDISKYRENHNIHFINEYISTDRLATLIRKSTFVVCPYISATQSGVISTCLALNKPVIATRVGGLEDMIENGVTGILIKEKNVDELVNAIRSLLDTPELINNMVHNIEKANKNGDNSWTNISKKYIAVYKKMLMN